MNLSDIVILSIKGADYCCIISRITESEAINLMQKISIWPKKAEHYKTWILLSHIKMGKEILTLGYIETQY